MPIKNRMLMSKEPIKKNLMMQRGPVKVKLKQLIFIEE